MGKLTATVYDKQGHIETGSQQGIKQTLKNKTVQTWKALVAEAKVTFTFRNSITALAVLMLTSVGVYTVSEKVADTESVYKVYIDGQYQGVVRNKSLLEVQIASYGEKMKAQVDFQPVHQSVNVTSEYSVAAAIDNSTKTITDMVAVRVNGEDVAFLKDQATADSLINKVKSQYVSSNAELDQIQVADKLEIVPLKGDKQSILDLEAAFQMIVTGKEEKKTYVVSRGDSLWDIALHNDMTVEELHEANPSIPNIDAIAEGQEINLTAVQPLINVVSTVEENRELTTNYEIVYEEDDTLDSGTEKVVQEGQEGKKQQVVRVTRRNGLVEKEDVLSETVVSEPTKEIVRKGTKKQVNISSPNVNGGRAAAASGSWAYPIGGGYVSSYYGENRGGKAHNAIDIAAGTGTAVYASNNGTVIGAGDAGDGYGNCIRISHGNGIVTIYGHLSSMNVSVGQAVQKGQRIGGVGSTGWSTGAHLHYEVRVGGAQVNPAPYM